MSSYGNSSVVAVGELMPDMLHTVLGEGVMVAFGSVAHCSVESGAGYHKNIGAGS